MLEITPNGEVVWEYVNPATDKGIVKTLITTEHENVFGGWSPMRYGVDHPGLVGKDLSRKGFVTDYHTRDAAPEPNGLISLPPEENY